MGSNRATPKAPRVASPDLPLDLAGPVELAPAADVIGMQLAARSTEASAAHGRLAESRLDGASLTRLDLVGATLSDVVITELRAVELTARDGVWRTVTMTGGRIGTLDGLRARWESVELRGVRIDYLSLPSAQLADVLIADAWIGTLDLPDARLDRVRFDSTRVDEVDTRGLTSTDLDLSGLDTLSFTHPGALSGAFLSARQVELHAAAFAAALGIRVLE